MTLLTLHLYRLLRAAMLRTQLRWAEEDAAWFDRLAGTEPIKAAAEARNARDNAAALRVRLILLETQ
jgi:hypothetical protein